MSANTFSHFQNLSTVIAMSPSLYLQTIIDSCWLIMFDFISRGDKIIIICPLQRDSKADILSVRTCRIV